MSKSGYVPKVPSKKVLQRYSSYFEQLKGAAPAQDQDPSVAHQMGLVHDQNEDQQTPHSESVAEVIDILSPHARFALERLLGKPKDCEEI